MNESILLCRYCLPWEAVQATNFWRGKPCCEDCLNYGQEMAYNEAQAEEGYARMIADDDANRERYEH